MRYAQHLSSYQEANVLGTKDLGRVLLDHLLDSLSCLLHEPARGATSMVDIGSGGGLPGIPLKIVRPDLRLTLVEATGKKSRFLRKVAEDLALRETTVINARAEEVGRGNEHRGGYAVATARALAPLPVLAEYCVPLVQEGGCAIAMKALPDDVEMAAGAEAAKILGAEISGVLDVEFLPELPPKRRTLVIMTKTGPTPEKYPRPPGTPKKRPLGVR
ncbi:MAG: 16S rRNA (guanine(527)-N(7))-methyltransferase RsmG [Rubrobacteraceae bacterium]